ncbi:MAG: cbb3-type cytochrome oxidase assembly protein CcoS [Armatimonadetes bacterium]|nr:cbb3-type cytochrome oxidase assembly protein CcoS [Armatimonadota bacterium]
MTFVEVWVGYAIVGTAAFSAAFIWAVRTRQFTDFDRARHIALDAASSIEPTEDAGSPPSRVDRYGLVALAVITLGVIVSAIWVGLRNI